jgi:hypothetical protein
MRRHPIQLQRIKPAQAGARNADQYQHDRDPTNQSTEDKSRKHEHNKLHDEHPRVLDLLVTLGQIDLWRPRLGLL